MNLRLKAPIVVAVASGIIFAATGYAAYRSQFDYIDSTRVEDMRGAAQALKSGLAAQARGASGQADFVANLAAVKEALRAGDREALAAVVGPIYKLQKSKQIVEEASFHSAALRTVLNLEKPARSGEDVSARETVARANRYREIQAGLEVTPSGLAMRAVASVDDGPNHLGSFEWGVGFKRLLDRIKTTTGAELSILVDVRTIPREAAPVGSGGRAGGSAAAEETGQGLRSVASTNADLVAQLLPNEFLSGVQDEVFVTRELGGTEYGAFAVPLFDFAGRQIGVTAGVKSMADSQAQVRQMRTIFLGATGVGVLLLAVTVFLVFNFMLLRPLADLGHDLAAFSAGDLNVIQGKPERADECGAILKAMNKLRDKILEEARVADEAKRAVVARASGRWKPLAEGGPSPPAP